MFVFGGICNTRSVGTGISDVVGGIMKEIMMEYGGAMVGVVGAIGFLFLMNDIIWGAGGLLPQLIRLGLGGGI